MPTSYADFDWQPIRETHEAFWADQLDRPILCITGSVPGCPAVEGFIPAYGDMPIDQIIDRTAEYFENTWYAGDGYPHLFTNYGAGVAAVYMKLATGHYEADGGVWFDPATDVEPESLSVQAHMDTDWLAHSSAFVRQAVEQFGGKVQVSLPDLGGMLDILASYRTTETLLTDLIDRPEAIDRLVAEVTEAWWVYYEHFYKLIAGKTPGSIAWAPAWSPKRTYMFQSDFAYMIGPEMFERFVVPELTECCRRVDHGFYHLDGAGQIPHLELLLGIEELRGVQWISGAGAKPAALWPDVLNPILEAGKKTQFYVTDPQEVFTMLETTGGGRNAIIYVGGLTHDEADDYVAAVHKASREARR